MTSSSVGKFDSSVDERNFPCTDNLDSAENLLLTLRKPAVRQCASFQQSTYMATANGKSLSPTVGVLGTLQTGAFRFLKVVDPLVSLSNYYKYRIAHPGSCNISERDKGSPMLLFWQ